MLKNLFASILIMFSLLLSIGAVSAQTYGYEETRNQAGYKQGDVYVIINTAVSALLSLLAVAFLGVCLYAGIRWMTARGKEEYAEKAKNALQAGAIGFIMVTLAYAISRFVLSKLMAKP
ncbi:hypothetical protein EPN28_00605 [Patescibacteria group bacterium]|nr:MAG: hypothetical protein EPN28_00605 [Patescibacteria group bacterium]